MSEQLTAEQEANLSDEFVSHLKGGEMVDTTETYEYLMAFRDRAWKEINSRLSLKEDLACEDIRTYNDLAGEELGRMQTFTGDKSPIDWVIFSDIGSPKKSFTNMHMTVWNDETTDVPHLGSAFGTLPGAFFYVDLMPRYELVSHPAHIDKYLAKLNEVSLALNKDIIDAGITPFAAVMPFIRASLSPVVLAGVVPLEFFKEKVEQRLWDAYQHWIELMENAEPVAEEKRAALKARDTLVRNNIVELDPANPIAVRLVGQEMADRLERILSGNERS